MKIIKKLIISLFLIFIISEPSFGVFNGFFNNEYRIITGYIDNKIIENIQIKDEEKINLINKLINFLENKKKILISGEKFPENIEEDYTIKEKSEGKKFEEKNTKINKKLFLVKKVIDGDTIKIQENQNSEKLTTIRIIGIDTPETKHPTKPVQCFGKEASQKAYELLNGKYVSIKKDSKSSKYDKYGRLLGYVLINGDDNQDFGLEMIKGGFAREYTYHGIKYDNQLKYKRAQIYSKIKGKGLWEKGVCDNFDKKQNNFKNVQDFNNSNISYINKIWLFKNGSMKGKCSIKGNISYKTKEKIFHMPYQKYYSKTRISTKNGEKYFCTINQAINSGRRISKE